MKNFRFLWSIALRDSRKNRSRLFLFLASIVMGVAALVAINSFRINVEKDIENQARELLGADLEINSRKPLADSTLRVMDRIDGELSRVRSFASMAYFPQREATRLVQIRAIEGAYPFYGKLETTPDDADSIFRKGKMALVDHTVMFQYDIETGDSIRIGEVTFRIAGRLNGNPGRSAMVNTAAPIVYIPMDYLDETGLIRKGSRVYYRFYYNLGERKPEKVIAPIKQKLEGAGLRLKTRESNKENYSSAFERLAGFLNLVAFLALLLGSIGVASTVNIYVREKTNTVAILRCLGVKGRDALLIFLIQILIMSALGALAGTMIGMLISFALPWVMQDILPVTLHMTIAWEAIFVGLLTGMVMAGIFALMPLSKIRRIAPMSVLRESVEHHKLYGQGWYYLLIFIFILGFALWQTGDLLQALIFSGGLFIAFGLLTLAAWSLRRLIRRFFPTGWSYVWRQAIANLFRPGNMTLVLIISIGLGTTLIATLVIVQHMLIEEVQIAQTGDQPNMILFDIQPDQKEEVRLFTRTYDMPADKMVPVVTMRLESINGRAVSKMLQDSTLEISRRRLSREYRVTYRDTLTESEKVAAGTWHGETGSRNSIIPVSISDDYAGSMKLSLGDTLVFDVQGALITTYISSFREIDWNRMTTNFLIVFPTGVLEKAPKFYVLVTRSPNEATGAEFQKNLVREFPNISVIDLKLILETLKGILDKITFVIVFLASFSIITGFMVLIAALFISKYQRIHEGVIIRTLGGSRRQIRWINGLEYFFLGTIASISGIVLAIIASWLLAVYSFDVTFRLNWSGILTVALAMPLLTVVIGWLNSGGIVNKPPMEVLRKEA